MFLEPVDAGPSSWYLGKADALKMNEPLAGCITELPYSGDLTAIGAFRVGMAADTCPDIPYSLRKSILVSSLVIDADFRASSSIKLLVMSLGLLVTLGDGGGG